MIAVKSRVAFGAVLATLVMIANVMSVSAQDPQPGSPAVPQANLPRRFTVTRIQSGPNGVTIFIGISNSQSGGSTGPTTAAQFTSGSSGPACTAQPALIGNASRDWFVAGAASHPDQVPYAVTCDGAFLGIVWLPGATTPGSVRVVTDPGGTVDPRSLVQSLLDTLVLPDIQIGVNPETGLVALPSWFWVEGYDGTPIVRSASLGGVAVDVELTAEDYRWSFGDGAALATTSLGRPYPAQSDLVHTYEQSSESAGGVYALRLTITFHVRFRVGDGPWLPLAPIVRTFIADYPVQQAQAVLTGR